MSTEAQRARFKDKYTLRAEMGLCRRCGKSPPVTGTTSCAPCKATNTRLARVRQKRHKALGLCYACTLPALPDKRACEKHRAISVAEDRREAQRTFLQRKIESGVCFDCNAPALPRKRRCEKHRVAALARYAKEREKWAKYRHDKYLAHIEESRAYGREQRRRLYHENVHRYRLKNQETQRKRRGLPGFHTVEQWLWRVAYYGWRCRWCKRELTNSTLTKDHVVATTKGGSDWPANLVPSCQSCNARKGNRALQEFLRILAV